MEDLGVLLSACRFELFSEVDDLLAFGFIIGSDVGARKVAVVIVDAINGRRALASATRIPANDVELLEQRLAVDRIGLHRELAAAKTRAARVHQQRANALAGLGGQVPRDEKVECAFGRILVVDRNPKSARLHAIFCGAEIFPVEGVARWINSKLGTWSFARRALGR